MRPRRRSARRCPRRCRSGRLRRVDAVEADAGAVDAKRVAVGDRGGPGDLGMGRGGGNEEQEDGGEPDHGISRKLGRIGSASIDCIVTSPPYLNAIDYMRGHKFSLVWFGYNLTGLRRLRARSVGAEISSFCRVPPEIAHFLANLHPDVSQRKRHILRRYYLDLISITTESYRVDRGEKSVWTRRLKRGNWLKVLTDKVVPGCEIGMEACAGANHWARELQSRGYEVKLMAPQFVKAYVKSNKNDANDAEAVCEAMSRPSMRFVEVKSVEQQDLQALHRVRSELVSHRTAKGNQIRGLVAEYGLVAPTKLGQLRAAIPMWLEDGGERIE